jgi:hypothetical protein
VGRPRLRRLLRRAPSAARVGTLLPAGGGGSRGRSARRRAEPRSLAQPLRLGPAGAGPDARDQPATLHGRGSGAARLSRREAGSAYRPLRPARDEAAGLGWREPGGARVRLAERDRPTAPRHRRRARRARGGPHHAVAGGRVPRLASRAQPDHPGSSLAFAVRRQRVPLHDAPGAPRARGRGPPARLRQRREPPARAVRLAPPGDRGPALDGREPLCPRPADAGGESRGRARRGRPGRPPRSLGLEDPQRLRADHGHARGPGRPGRRVGPARDPRARHCLGPPLRHAPRPPRVEPAAGGGPQGGSEPIFGRAPPEPAVGGTRGRAARALGRAPGGGGALHPQPAEDARRAPRLRRRRRPAGLVRGLARQRLHRRHRARLPARRARPGRRPAPGWSR